MLRLSRRWLLYLLPASAVFVLLAGGGFAALETDTVESYGEGVWWSLSIITTVGFVGGSPTTTVGRVLAGLLMVSGFALLSLVTAAIASIFVRDDEEPVERREAAFEAKALEELREVSRRLERLERRFDDPGGDGQSR